MALLQNVLAVVVQTNLDGPTGLQVGGSYPMPLTFFHHFDEASIYAFGLLYFGTTTCSWIAQLYSQPVVLL